MGHTGAYIINSFFTGSSPPMLGIPLSAPGGDLSKWFIPTYVGHTKEYLLIEWEFAVHPHIRGAYFLFVLKSRTTAGSSPHTWGIRRGLPDLRPADRFIPTYVGHTAKMKVKHSSSTVHPHIRGAYISLSWLASPPFGSSPHTWGIRSAGFYLVA